MGTAVACFHQLPSRRRSRNRHRNRKSDNDPVRLNSKIVNVISSTESESGELEGSILLV